MLPVEVVTKVQVGGTLDMTESEMVARLPAMSERVLSHIPRLENVRAVLKYARSGKPSAKGQRKDVPIGASILEAVHDLALAEAREGDTLRAIDSLKENSSEYDPRVLDAITVVCKPLPPELRSLALAELQTGMLLAADVRARSGIMLVASGHRVTATMLERLRNVGQRVGVVEPIVCQLES